MIFEARKPSRRCTIVTLRPKRVRKIASSIAESPPPTTTMCLSRKNAPSQVAQVDTPRPRRRASPGMFSQRALAPVATITLSAVYSSSSVRTTSGRREKSTEVTSTLWMTEPKRSACARKASISSGPMMPSAKPG